MSMGEGTSGGHCGFSEQRTSHLQDFHVTSTATNVSRQEVADLFLTRSGHLILQRFDGQNHSRSAKSTLKRTGVDKSLLDRMEFTV